ncbi:MAG: FHA domain-containing protein [Betaproteobacteria bacterium]|nr:FHA domain-containing protein [Betaproteobacteria bacterium]
MSNSHFLCILIAEIVGEDRLATRLGETETARAVERCMNRIDLAIDASSGQTIARDRSAIIAMFKQCNDAVIAACDAIDRVRKLPPVSGMLMQSRIGIHYGEVKNNQGEGVDGARLILQACGLGQSLASSLVIDNLYPAVRKFVSAEPFYDNTLNSLPWPVFMIGVQNTTTVSPASPLSPHPRSRQEYSSPLTSLKPSPTAWSSAERFSSSQHMQLKHQQNTLVIDRKRPVILVGRELGNDIVIVDPRASRQHARIERRPDSFMLIDESTNGCFVVIDGEEEQCLKGTTLPLTGSGRFGCGFSPKKTENDTVFFELF